MRAGLIHVHTDNAVCGDPVSSTQAISDEWIEFACDLPRLSRYVSVDNPYPRKSLTLMEVQVFTCKSELLIRRIK